MPLQLAKFTVSNLHGQKDVHVDLRDNKVILVGENGSGKSTIVNLLYYCLTRQFHRASAYRFDYVELDLNNEIFRLSKDEMIQAKPSEPMHLSARWDRKYKQIATTVPPSVLRDALDDDLLSETLAERFDVPADFIRYVTKHFVDERESENLVRFADALTSCKDIQFLYLPTYRRIEQDLQSIFRKSSIDVDELSIALSKGAEDTYVELVHFGMEDVDRKIKVTLGHLKDALTTALNNLTGSYLRDIIQGAYEAVNYEQLKDIDWKLLDSMLDRIPDDTLPQSDKVLLRSRIDAIADRRSFQPSDNVIAHFLLKLYRLNAQQQDR